VGNINYPLFFCLFKKGLEPRALKKYALLGIFLATDRSILKSISGR